MNRIVRSIILIIILSSFVFFTGTFKAFTMPSTVRAFGELTVDFHVPINTPFFSISNAKPGDIISKQVDITNTSPAVKMVSIKGVRTNGDTNPKLDDVLSIIIYDGLTPLYGQGSATGKKTLSQFFTESTNGILLSPIDPQKQKTYTIAVSFDQSSDNSYQGKSVVFDIAFGTDTQTHVVINQVFFNVDKNHGTDSLKDRTGTSDIGKVNINQFCGITNYQNQVTTLTNQLNSQIAQEAKNANFAQIAALLRTFNLNLILLTKQSNQAIVSCSKSLTENDEWVELFNPTSQSINVLGWTFVDNSGQATTIVSPTSIAPNASILLSQSVTTWNFWNTNKSKVSLGRPIGNGLENAGDIVILKDSKGEEIDRVSWGTNMSGFNPPASVNTTSPGKSISRTIAGFDTDSVSDWTINSSPNP